MDYIENVNNFKEEIQAHGWNPGEIWTDSKLHRFDTDRRGDKVGWYVAHANGDFVAGAFGSWKSGEKYTWCSKNGTRTQTDHEQIKKMFDDMEKQREKVKKTAQQRAKWTWNHAKPAEPDHPYLLKKGVQPHGVRQYKGALIIPVLDNKDEIISLQFIGKDGTKRFLKGGTVAGGRWTIPGDEQQILCEGYATGCSIAEATGSTVRISFNAGNLLKVAEPGWTIGGDNDKWTKDQHGEPWNPGREKALTAAWQYNCRVVIPTFPDNGTEQPTDFNDLHAMAGIKAVSDQISGAVYPAEYLLKECETDVGACYRKEHIVGLKLYKQRNKAAYMSLRAKLKTLKTGISELEKTMKEVSVDGEGGAPDHLTLAKEIIQQYGTENLIYSQSFIWHWSGSDVWQAIDDRQIKTAINSKVEKALDGATKSAVDSILDFFKTEIFLPDHEWDSEPTTVNCSNGELFWDGTAWDLQPHTREHYRTTQIPISYDPEATAPRFEKFLDEIFQKDEDKDLKQVLICEIIGYTLLSTARYEKFIILIGPGANGKSVLLEVVVALVGTANTAAVQPSKFDSAFQRAHLHLKLLNAVSELAIGEEIKDDKMKSITSGELITCEHKFKKPFDLKPYCTIWMGSNHMPHTRDFSDALFRRAIIIQFNRVFAEKEQDKQLKDELKKELPGILNLALEGMAGVFKRGFFTEPESCQAAKKEWRLGSDQAAEFCEDRCALAPGLAIESFRLYTAYKNWVEECGIKKALNRKNFTERIEKLGAWKARGTGGVRMLAGIGLDVFKS